VIRPLPDFSRSPSPSREECKQPLDKPLDTRPLSKNPLRRSASSAVQHSNGSSGMHSSAAASKHKDAVSGSSGSSGRTSSSTRKVRVLCICYALRSDCVHALCAHCIARQCVVALYSYRGLTRCFAHLLLLANCIALTRFVCVIHDV
jgi:hypothetical protein